MIKWPATPGFTLDEVAELLQAGGHGRNTDGLAGRARAKLAEVENRIADLTVGANTLRTALAAGCDDLIACAANRAARYHCRDRRHPPCRSNERSRR